MKSVDSATLLLLLLLVVPPVLASTVPCEIDGSTNADVYCESLLRSGSRCVNGFCTNPFYYGGCLQTLHTDWKNKTRVCNSDDPPDAETLGYCHVSAMDYTEVRLAAQNWESHNFGAWILTILLSEILDVPVTLEAGSPSRTVNFYDEFSRNDYQESIFNPPFPELAVSEQVKDCRTVYTTDPSTYQGCYHVLPELWWDSRSRFVVSGMEQVRDLGALGENALFVPQFAAEQDNSLVSWLGLQHDRQKMAETFPTPTNWNDYCQFVSPTQCQEPDETAQRPPQSADEEIMYFHQPSHGRDFTGYFRITEQNNCTRYPHNCTGHVATYPCGWASYVTQQFHHLDIPLQSTGPTPNRGYSYAQLTQLWAAANATRTPVMMLWWSPEPVFEAYVDTAAAFTRVLLPHPTQECLDARIDYRTHCNADLAWNETVGDPAGACDTFPQVLQKGMGTALRDISIGVDIPVAFHNPAYQVVTKYKLSNVQMGKIFEYWLARTTDKWHYDQRDAVCQFVVENLDWLLALVPESYPRVVHERHGDAQKSLSKAALAMAVMAVVLCVGALVLTCLKRATKVMYYLQMEFFGLMCMGMLLVSVAALIQTLDPSNLSCAVYPWLVNLGFLFQLVPLVYRMAKIQRLATSGRKMQRVRLLRKDLLLVVGGFGAFVVAFLLAWSIVDTPREVFQYSLSTVQTEQGETIVDAFDYCGSDSDVWYLVAVLWPALLAVPGCILAVLATQIKEDMNDTKPMAILIYMHFFFLLLWAFIVGSDTFKSEAMKKQSLILSIDTILAAALYVYPKFLDSGENLDAEPLPDVFVHTTVALVDLCGFTAWSSVREPVSVFQFLETIYSQYDKIAARHGVTTIETVAECYVAATGVPQHQPDHAVLMAKFCSDVMKKMPSFIKKQEVTFGPDTADLSIMIGMHSGPVTGGFLKGKGSRFQLFGDVMTTASLLLANSESGKVHMSQETAALLTQAKVGRWVLEREDVVETEEKGEMRTFYLVKGSHLRRLFRHIDTPGIYQDDSSVEEDVLENEELLEMETEQRWIDWNVEIFKSLLKQIVARRAANPRPFFDSSSKENVPTLDVATMPFFEVKEIIELPEFDRRAAMRFRDNETTTELPDNVVEQLKEYITLIAEMYNHSNDFHNFAHASYVVLAVTKYMNRIIAASGVDLGKADNADRFRGSTLEALHDHTYGICSDPLTFFAVAFAAMIHDVDHPGVPNPQFIKENAQIAMFYKERSVVEQKSLDLSWNLLVEDRFQDLLHTICPTISEMSRFRGLVVNSVMATDLQDKDLKLLRNTRWQRAFDGQNGPTAEESSESVNRKATIVIEHLIQAADVAHCSQHWHIYRKWNNRLFKEQYKAYRKGRAEKNPADFWYEGEIDFFDHYIVPLSKKLRDCGVFGPTSDENLNYANSNRGKWEKEGEELVSQMLEEVEAEYDEQDCTLVGKMVEQAKEGASYEMASPPVVEPFATRPEKEEKHAV
ncbi:Receptor-type guanylate cyclase gcy [Seminavis robusta]|uniref:Receptor-type guanylate cyclase gcy n=1 Tax=Seminavis robusta TaxID=568900 RepID=A0A9N8HQL2_9STRA|nr:Receptor-type guanylate cyclase gcy [Seminavis robusta]|eukprot:Sro1300_g260740.1 Receptor-type guanylate cyclase gcy (1475) ;mRNA; r:16419-21909